MYTTIITTAPTTWALGPLHTPKPLKREFLLLSHSDSYEFRTSILDQLQLFPLPVPPNVTPRPVTAEEKARIDTLSELQFVSEPTTRLATLPDLSTLDPPSEPSH